MRVLLVEDSQILRDSLSTGLRQAGYAVDSAADGKAGLWSAQSNDYDVIVLDLMLPELDGLSLLQKIRAEGKEAQVLILTAKDAIADRVKGLREGADDYMVKPFDLGELDARIRAVLRRSERAGPQEVVLGALRLSSDGVRVLANDQPLGLTPREIHVLRRLLKNAGRVVTKAQLTETLAALNEDIGDKTIEVYIHRIRHKIQGYDVEIVTVRGFGYMLRALRTTPATAM